MKQLSRRHLLGVALAAPAMAAAAKLAPVVAEAAPLDCWAMLKDVQPAVFNLLIGETFTVNLHEMASPIGYVMFRENGVPGMLAVRRGKPCVIEVRGAAQKLEIWPRVFELSEVG